MNYLIDTHVLIWVITDITKLSKQVKSKLEDNSNSIFVSAISFWEISMKYSLGKLQLNGVLPEELPKIITDIGFVTIPLDPEVAACYNNLTSSYHRDPFDRMLIWQSIRQKYIFISKDDRMKQYRSEGLQVLW